MKSKRHKIFFAPNWGLTSAQMLDDYRHQSPGNSGVWNSISATLNPEEADFLIIQDLCDFDLWSMFKPEQRLYFSREALTPRVIDKYPDDLCEHFSFWDGTGMLWVKWWYPNKFSGGINMTYDQLKRLDPVKKTESLSGILSGKTLCEGHHLRNTFVAKFKESYSDFHLYGRTPHANRTLQEDDKSSGILDYKYHLAFDNQDTIVDFFGTCMTDAVLLWSLPIFWGGGDVNKYFPEGACVKFDVRDEKEVNRIIDFIENDDYESHLDDLAEARDLILDNYNMWAVIEDSILSLGE